MHYTYNNHRHQLYPILSSLDEIKLYGFDNKNNIIMIYFLNEAIYIYIYIFKATLDLELTVF